MDRGDVGQPHVVSGRHPRQHGRHVVQQELDGTHPHGRTAEAATHAAEAAATAEAPSSSSLPSQRAMRASVQPVLQRLVLLGRQHLVTEGHPAAASYAAATRVERPTARHGPVPGVERRGPAGSAGAVPADAGVVQGGEWDTELVEVHREEGAVVVAVVVWREKNKV